MVTTAPSGRPPGWVGRWLTTSRRSPLSRTWSVASRPESSRSAIRRSSADVPDAVSLGFVGQAEETFCLVVGEHEAAVAVGDDDAFADGVEDRVVVLVHAGHLLRAEPVGLAAQASADERGADGGEGQAGGDGQEDDRELAVEAPVTFSTVRPADTRPTTLPSAPLTGTTAWISLPRGPSTLSVWTLPGGRARWCRRTVSRCGRVWDGCSGCRWCPSPR